MGVGRSVFTTAPDAVEAFGHWQTTDGGVLDIATVVPIAVRVESIRERYQSWRLRAGDVNDAMLSTLGVGSDKRLLTTARRRQPRSRHIDFVPNEGAVSCAAPDVKNTRLRSAEVPIIVISALSENL